MTAILRLAVSALLLVSATVRADVELSVSDVVINRQTVDQASAVMGYVAGQHLVLDQVASQHPDLAPDVWRLEKLFLLAYRQPDESANAILQAAIPDEAKREGLMSTVIDNLKAQLVRPYSRDEGIQFLQEMQGRIDGAVPSPVLETMLWMKYISDPANEITDRHTQSFSSRGLEKSLGTSVELKLPSSWQAEDGNRPHIVQKWTSQYGAGSLFISLMIQDTGGERIGDADIEEAFRNPDWSPLVVDGGEFLDAKMVVIEGRKAIRMDQKAKLQRLDLTLPAMMRFYMVPSEETLVSVQCIVVADPPEPEDGTLPGDFERLKSVCDAVANTVVFPDAY